MSLNIGDMVYQNQKSNKFRNNFKHNTNIVEAYNKILKPYLKSQNKTYRQNFHPILITKTKDEFVIADTSNYVLKSVRSTFQKLYRHDSRINCLTCDKENNIIISGGMDQKVMFYSLENQDFCYESIRHSNVITAISLDISFQYLYIGDQSGEIYLYRWNSLELEKKIKFDQHAITVIQPFPSQSTVFFGNSNGWFYSFDLEIKRKKRKFESSGKYITCMAINELDEMLFVGLDNGDMNVINVPSAEMISSWNFSQSSITQLIYLEHQEKLLILEKQGRILIYSILDETSIELRRYRKDGLWKGVTTEKDEFLYLIGNKEFIEQWNIMANEQVETLSRDFLDDNEDTYEHFIYNKTTDNLIGFSNNFLLYWKVNKHEQLEIRKKQILQPEMKIKFLKQYQKTGEVIIVQQNNSIIFYDTLLNKINLSIPQFDFEISTLFFDKLRPHIYIIGEEGQIVEWSLKQNQSMNIHKILAFSKILFCFYIKNEQEIYVLKEGGNLVLLNYINKQILEEKIINEDQITLFDFCEKTNTLFTCSKGGVIVMTSINYKNEIEYEEILDKGSDIINLKCNEDGTMLVYQTDQCKCYLYQIQTRFSYDKFSRMRIQVSDIFFSNTSKSIFFAQPNGNIFEQILQPQTNSVAFESFSSKKTIDIAINDKYLFVAKENHLQIWNLFQQSLEREINSIDKILIMKMGFKGEYLYFANPGGIIEIWNCYQFERIKKIQILEDNSIQIVDFDISFSETLLVIYFDNDKIILYDLEKNQISQQFEANTDLTQIKISPDEKKIIGVIGSGQLKVYEYTGKSLSYLGKKSNFFRDFLIMDNSLSVCMIYKDSTVQIWNAVKGENVDIFEPVKKSIQRGFIDFEDKTLLLVSNRGQISYINLQTGKILKEDCFGDFGKVKFVRYFNKKLVFSVNNVIYVYNTKEQLNYPEKQYIKKSFEDYGKVSSENDFLTHFRNVKSYSQSLLLQRQFNPILVCSMFNYQQALQDILKNKLASYPMLNQQFQISPLILAIKLGNLNIAQVILKYLSSKPQEIYWTNREMREMLNYKHEFTHKYLTNFMVEIQFFTNTNIKIPLLSQFQEKCQMHVDLIPNFTPEKYKQFSMPIDNYGNQNMQLSLKNQKSKVLGHNALESTQSSIEESVNTQTQTIDKNEIKQMKITWQPTKFYRINGYYDFNIGSEHSISFLTNYSKSTDYDFVLSNWKYIIDYKWERVFVLLIPICMIFWCYCVFFSIYFINPKSMPFFWITLTFLILYFIYEIFSVSFSGFKKYVQSIFNILDLILILLGVVILILTYVYENRNDDQSNITLKYFQIFTLGFTYFRALTYLRIFKWFRNVIHMLIAVTVTSSSFLIIIASFIFAISVMFVKAKEDNKGYFDLLRIDFESVQGEIDFDTDSFKWLSWVIFIVNSIFLPIILLNFLIAKMTSKYEELELKENFTSYIEKAKMIAEIEYFYIIKNYGKNKLRNYFKSEVFTFFVRNSHKDVSNVIDQLDNSHDDNLNTLEELNELHFLYNKQIKLKAERESEIQNKFDEVQENYEALLHEIGDIRMEQDISKEFLQEKIGQLQQLLEIVDNKVSQRIEKNRSERSVRFL